MDGGATTTHEIPGLGLAVRYDVRVRATRGSENGPWSSPITETTLDDVAPDAPTLDSATPGSGDSVTLRWTAPAGGTPVTSYKWQFTPAPAAPSSQWTDGGTGITGLTATGAAANARTRHTAFRVIAVNARGNSPSSNVRTVAGPPGAVGSLAGAGRRARRPARHGRPADLGPRRPAPRPAASR